MRHNGNEINPDEMLIDTELDPGEMVNITDHPNYQEDRKELKILVLKHISNSNIQEKEKIIWSNRNKPKEGAFLAY